MAEISVKYMGYAENPQPGVAIERAVPLGYFPSIKYGDAFIARVGVKNTSPVTAKFDVFICLKDSEGRWRAYAYSPTPDLRPGEERDIAISKVAPDGYLIRIPAYARASWEGVNAVKGIVWKDSVLANKEFDAFYAEPDPFSIGYEEHCFCEGIDERGYPINKKSEFRSDERMCYYVRSLYDNRGFRITFTVHAPGYLPWTAYANVEPKKNVRAVAVYFCLEPPLAKGTWEIYTRIAGDDVIKDTAIVR